MADEQNTGTQAAATGTDQVSTEQQQASGLPQAEVDRLVGQARTQARERLLKELGVENLDSLKKVLQGAKAQEEASKSELQKAQERLAEMQAALETANTKRTEAMLRSAITAQATALGFLDPADAWSMLPVASLKISDDGNVEGLDDALKALAKNKPYLLRPKGNLGASGMGHGQGVGESASGRRARLYGGNSLDLTQGGGVFWPTEKK